MERKFILLTFAVLISVSTARVFTPNQWPEVEQYEQRSTPIEIYEQSKEF